MMDAAGQQWLAAQGIQALKPSDALDAFEHLVAAAETQAVVASVDWGTFLPVYEARGARPIMERMRAASAAPSLGPADRTFVDRLAALLPFERRELIALTVRDHVARVIGVERQVAVGMEEGLFDLGMDSLMATELRRVLERQFDRALPPTLTFDYPSVAALSGFLETECFGGAVEETSVLSAAPGTAGTGDLAAAIAALEALSDDEAEVMLRGGAAGGR
jgi:acyl carrier protein